MRVRFLTGVGLALAMAGCVTGHPNPAMRALVTPNDPKLAIPDTYWDQPAVVHVRSNDFVKLWNACEGELYVRLFTVDRQQYRNGLLTSEPMVSKQIFEPWRTDAVSYHDELESTAGTIRRTVRFVISKSADGGFDMTPKVLVERFASAERRLTAITQYHQAFSGPRVVNDNPDQNNAPTASDFWYPLRRDTDLEKDMAANITAWLAKT